MTNNKKKGFTAIEILIVISAILVISLVTFQSFRNLNNFHILEKEALQVASVLHQAQELTLASKNSNQYGVHFAPSQVTIFQGTSYISGDASNVVVDINSAVTISSIALTGGGPDIIFNRLTGTTNQWGTTTLTLVSSSTSALRVVTYPSGVVDIN